MALASDFFVFSTNICLIWLYLAIVTTERHASVIKKRFFSSRFTLEISYFSPFAREDTDASGYAGLPKSFFGKVEEAISQ